MYNEQEAFEAFALTKKGWDLAKVNGVYVFYIVATAWESWKACAVLKDAEILEQCRLNGMGAQRELALLAKLDMLERKIMTLEAK